MNFQIHQIIFSHIANVPVTVLAPKPTSAELPAPSPIGHAPGNGCCATTSCGPPATCPTRASPTATAGHDEPDGVVVVDQPSTVAAHVAWRRSSSCTTTTNFDGATAFGEQHQCAGKR